MTRVVSILRHVLPLALGMLLGHAGLGLWQIVHAGGATPTIQLVQPGTGSIVEGTVTLSAAASGPGFTSVRFLVNGVMVGSEITAGNCTRNWNTTNMADGPYSLMALARTDSGEQAASPDVVVTVANRAPQIFDVKVWNISAAGASVTWYTNLEADSQVEFGRTSSYGDRTSLDPSGLTIHTQVLTGLTPGTAYHVRVSSRSGLGKAGASRDVMFVTAGSPPMSAAGAPPGVPAPLAGLAAFASQVRMQVTTALAATAPVRILTATVRAAASTAVITWTTDQAADAQVEYGRGIAVSRSPRDPRLATDHSVTLTGLQPGKTYSYRLRSRNAQGREATSSTLTFTTVK